MYTRIPTGRYPRGMRVPENYGGSAFRPQPNDPPDEKPLPQVSLTEAAEALDASRASPSHDEPPSEAPNESSVSAGRFSLGLPFLRRDGMGIGFEELLLLGLIFLIAQEGKNNDLVWLLVLLLLIS